MSDSYVQVPTDGSGKKIDNSVLTQDDGTTVVYRQRIVISDDSSVDAHAAVGSYDPAAGEEGIAVRPIPGQADRTVAELLFRIWEELREQREPGGPDHKHGRWVDPPSAWRVKALASTNLTVVRGGPTQLVGWYLFNKAAAPVYLKLYDLARNPALATDTPLFTVPLPTGGGAVVNFSTGLPAGAGVPFFTGLAYAITGGVTDTDTTATAADDVHGFLLHRQLIYDH